MPLTKWAASELLNWNIISEDYAIYDFEKMAKAGEDEIDQCIGKWFSIENEFILNELNFKFKDKIEYLNNE